MGLVELTDRDRLKLMTIEYSIEEDGHFLAEPIVELFCRDAEGNRRRIEVEGFYPSFYITEQEYQENEHDIFNESTIRSIVARYGVTSDDNSRNSALEQSESAPRQTLHGEPLVKIETVEPSHVRDIRDMGIFDQTWEGDVFFTNLFLVDSGIKDGLSIPKGQDRVHYDDIRPIDEPPEVSPRMVTIDIEVWSGGKFPDTQDPKKPVTAVTVHDSYDDEYLGAILHPDSTDVTDDYDWGDVAWQLPDTVDECPIEVFHDEAEMLGRFNQWIAKHDPDLLTGWNSSRNEIGSGFDYPYWINRCERINEWTVENLAYENGRAFVTNRGAPVIGGTEMFDMLQAYKKTQIHEKRSYSLGYIAQDELGYGKEDVEDLDTGWTHEPADFMQYNIRDVEAVVEIENVKRVLDMYDHIRSIVGATYSEIADSNIGIIDMLFLREAKEQGYALPTSTRPEVQHYWGAYVFPPEAGKHKNVVYPDLSSLYPNLFRDMNASPETIIGFEEDLRESEYSKDDCHIVYVDTRSEQEKRDADDPERTELYVLKPEVKESFVRGVVQDLIDMKYEYKKDEYSSEAYGAVKRITNSVYGVMGDSVSYGKGFRLFDWRIAEAITLAGRDVIKHTATEFETYVTKNGYPGAEIISGDTDSCVCEVPDADGMDETLEIAQEAVEYVDDTYDEFMQEQYNMDENNMAVEIESYAASALFMNKKKRYAQWVRWDEGDEVDEVEVKGFELVRSDSAEITGEVQREVLSKILKQDDAESSVSEYLKENWDAVVGGDVSPTDIGKPSAINNPLYDYGWSQSTVEKGDQIDDINGNRLERGDDYVHFFTPQPHIRGARYANKHIGGEDISEGAKPMMFYCDGVSLASGLSEVYDYEDQSLNAPENVPYKNQREMTEMEREVDAVAVEDVSHLPEGVLIDWNKMAEKTLRDPIEPIVDVVGWDFDDLVADGTQSGLADFM